MTDAEQLTLLLAPSIAPISDEWLRCCNDCLADVVEIRERYMVHDHVWPIAEDGGALCVGCLERRIGRSKRLDSRMTGSTDGASESESDRSVPDHLRLP